MILKKKVISGLRWTAGARFITQLFTWSITIVVIRLLSPADYGLMELAGVFVAFLAMLGELGLGAAVIQRENINKNELKALFGFVLLSSVFLYLLLFLLAPLIAVFYIEPRLVPLIRVLAIQFLLMGFTVLPQSLLTREMSFRKLAMVDFFSSIAGSVTTLALALFGFGVWALVWGSLVIRVVTLISLMIYQPFICMPRLIMTEMGSFLSFGVYVILSRIIWYFYSKADIFIIGKVLGKELLGIYAIGAYLASLPMEKVSGIMTQVAFPAFSSMQSEPKMAGQHFLKAVRVTSFFAFPILWGISSISSDIVGIFLGPKWSDASLPLQLISLGIPIRMISNLMSPAVLGMGRPDISFHNSLLAFFIMPVAFVVGSFWGLWGISMVWVTVFPLVFFLNLSRVVKILGVKFSDVLRAMQAPFGAGLVMYCVVLVLKAYLVTNLQLIPKMVILVFCGVVTFSFMTLLSNRSGLREVRELAKISP